MMDAKNDNLSVRRARVRVPVPLRRLNFSPRRAQRSGKTGSSSIDNVLHGILDPPCSLCEARLGSRVGRRWRSLEHAVRDQFFAELDAILVIDVKQGDGDAAGRGAADAKRQDKVRVLSLMPRVRRALDFRIESRVAALPKACISSFSAGVKPSS